MIQQAISYKDVFSAIAIALTFYAFLPYIRSILLNKTRPHVFSWVIWGSTTFIVFLAQLSDHAGVGAWPIGISGVISISVAILAYAKKSDHTITTTDWMFFIAAMSALPFWYFTADPLWAVVILTGVDVIGFGPTIRKAFHYPHEEQLTFYMIFVVRNLFVMMALENYSLTTVIFPTATALACVVLVVLTTYRRIYFNKDI